MQKLLTYIHSLAGFTPESWEALQPVLSTKRFAEGDYLLKEGEVCNSLFFIDEGVVRSFYEEDGSENNTAFYFEGDMATNIASFGNGGPSSYSIQACGPVTAIVFDKQKLFEAISIVPQIGILGKNSLKYTASKLEEYGSWLTLYTPTERYQYLGRNKPELLQKVPSQFLASYLGMAKETLGRIRGRRVVV